MRRSFVRTLLPLLAVAAAASGCQSGTATEELTVYGVLQQSTAHATFMNAVASTGSTGILQGSEAVTVFAPNDQAFAALPDATRDAIFSDPEKLRAVIRNHLVAGTQSTASLTDGRTLTSLQGSTLTITRAGNSLQVNDADVILDNLGGQNGVVHVIDSVLIPPGVL